MRCSVFLGGTKSEWRLILQHQKQHHAEGTLWAEAEATFEEYEAEESEGGIE
jgi:hypothetical protein